MSIHVLSTLFAVLQADESFPCCKSHDECTLPAQVEVRVVGWGDLLVYRVCWDHLGELMVNVLTWAAKQ